MSKVVVIGAGALGLTAAFELLKKGYKVTVIERSEKIGGLLSSFKIGSSYIEEYYHHLFQTDQDAISLIKELGLEEKLWWRRPETAVFCEGSVYPFDSPIDVLRFSPLTFLERLRLGLVLLYLKLKPTYKGFESVEASFWIKKWMGTNSYTKLWEPLLKGKFGEYAQDIAMSWFWSRIKVRTSKLGYLRGGFYQLYETLSKKIISLGGEIQIGVEINEILGDGSKIEIATNKGIQNFDACVATIPTNIFFKLTRSLPSSFVKKYQWPDYFGAQIVFLELSRPITNLYWLNIAERNFPFLAYIEHTNFMPKEDYGGETLVYLGNYFSKDDPRYLQEENSTIEQYLSFMRKINPKFKKSWLIKGSVFRTTFAQPLVRVGYDKHIPPHKLPIKNLYLANMAQVYPQDRGQNYSIRLAKKVVETYFP